MSNHVIRWIEEDGIKWYTAKKPPERVFIRFGKWGRRHRSYIGNTHSQEQGLSVYNARLEEDGSISLIAYDTRLITTAEDCASLLAGRCAFPVTGKVVGVGTDGEPVLTQVKVLRAPIRFDSMPKEIREIS
jgi:hypothetical protein